MTIQPKNRDQANRNRKESQESDKRLSKWRSRYRETEQEVYDQVHRDYQQRDAERE